MKFLYLTAAALFISFTSAAQPVKAESSDADLEAFTEEFDVDTTMDLDTVMLPANGPYEVKKNRAGECCCYYSETAPNETQAVKNRCCSKKFFKPVTNPANPTGPKLKYCTKASNKCPKTSKEARRAGATCTVI